MTSALPPEVEAARQALCTVAVTGTNGKSTTTSMIEAIVAASGEPSVRVTTLGAWVNGEQVHDDPDDSSGFFSAVVRGAQAGARTLALETTSKALAEGFSHQWPARVAVFTNLSRDHFDYHGTPEQYLAAKAQLFMTLPEGGTAVLNAADPSSALISDVTAAGITRRWYSGGAVAPECRDAPLALAARSVQVARTGTSIELAPSPLSDALGGALRLSVIGRVNADNALAAALATHAAGYAPDAIRRGLEGFAGVDGRFQVVVDRPFTVVDYAHTPDALERTLQCARELAGGARVWVVFGCGGERDQGKRPEMGATAARWADHVIVTSDNPRGEDPEAIIAAICSGIDAARVAGGEDPSPPARSPGGEVRRVSDREAAIREALISADASDIVVIAGKGHERVQKLADRIVQHSDAEVARATVRARKEEIA